jgi:hypothetical protein
MTLDNAAHKSKLRALPAESIKLLEQSTPAAGRRDKTWLECRTTERNILTDFWDQVSVTFREKLESTTRMEREEIDQATSVISVSNSVEYAELVKNERLQVSDAIAAAAALAKDTAAFRAEERFLDTGPDLSTLVIGDRVVKPSTRPAHPASETINQTVPLEFTIDEGTDSADQQQISTTPRALEVIRKMFPTSIEEVSAKDTDRDLFVHAMNDLSFNARNVGGSGVAFEHPSKKKIIFHRPHPVAKIDSVMLQSMGKRLSKHFGWNRDTFLGV